MLIAWLFSRYRSKFCLLLKTYNVLDFQWEIIDLVGNRLDLGLAAELLCQRVQWSHGPPIGTTLIILMCSLQDIPKTERLYRNRESRTNC